jgi:hypothetical protein
MTALANAIYKQLLRRLRSSNPSITYGELAAAVAVHHRNPHFLAALGELTTACRERDLPCLPAIVWSASMCRPADGYYRVAHPRARGERSRVAAWEREQERLVREADRFPRTL